MLPSSLFTCPGSYMALYQMMDETKFTVAKENATAEKAAAEKEAAQKEAAVCSFSHISFHL